VGCGDPDVVSWRDAAREHTETALERGTMMHVCVCVRASSPRL
jgi:hypothetical protein